MVHIAAARYSDDASLSRASGRFGSLFSSVVHVGDIDSISGVDVNNSSA